MRICKWCDGAMEQDNQLNVCRACLPNPDLRYVCTVDSSHLPTIGADYCATCRLGEEQEAARKNRNAPILEKLRAIRAQHVADFNKPWPGCEFGKTLVGQMIDKAIRDLE